MPFYIIATLLVLLDFFLGAYVLVKNPGRLNSRAFALFSFSAGLWTLGIVLLFSSHNFNFNKLIMGAGVVMIFGFFLFAKTFPEVKTLNKKFWLNLLPFIFLIITVPFNIYVKGMYLGDNGIPQPILSPFFPIYASLTGGYAAYSALLLALAYKNNLGKTRQQLQYIFLGAVLFISIAILCDAVLPALGIYNYNLVGPMASAVFIAFTAYAIVRHNLFDIKVVLQKSLTYSFLLVIIFAFYEACLFLLNIALTKNSLLNNHISVGLTIIAGVSGVSPLEKYFRKFTDRWFFKEPYNYGDALHILSRVLNQNWELSRLMAESDEALRRIFKVSFTGVTTINPLYLFRNGLTQTIDERPLVEEIIPIVAGWKSDVITMEEVDIKIQDNSTDEKTKRILKFLKGRWQLFSFTTLIKISSLGKLVGFLHLSDKLSEEPLKPQDIQLLKTYTNQLATALEKAEAYQKLKEYTENLEAKVEERTREIKNMQLRQKQVMEDISHGLQTPLTILKAELELFGAKQPGEKEQLATMEKSIDKVSVTISDLLKLARLETPLAETPMQEFGLSGLLAEVLDYVEVIAENNGIKLLKFIEDNIKIAGDPKQIEELITNLLSNAVKFSKKNSEQKIEVSLKTKNSFAVMQVKDQGKGIAEEDLYKIFHRFYRSTNSGTPTQGSGLGLSICKAICERHGGKISATSHPTQGSCFTVTLPLP